MQDVGRTLQSHQQHVQPIADKYPEIKVGAPAMTNGEKSENGTSMGVLFLEPFIKGCDERGLRIDFVAAHWYDEWPADPTQQGYKLDYFKDHLKKIHKAGGERPVWLTEFGVWTGDQIDFVNKVMPWLDDQDWIERYAFHYATPGVLLNGDVSGLSELGKAYVTG
jgi:endo-1,4-beta-mannosidase